MAGVLPSIVSGRPDEVVDPVAAPVVNAPVVAPPVQTTAAPPPPTVMPSNSRQAAQAAYGAGQDQANALMGAANAQSMASQESIDALGRQMEIENKFQQDSQVKLDALQNAAKETADQYKALNDEAGRVQIIDRRSTGQKSLGILAVALGGLGDALGKMGGSNTDFGARVSAGIDQAVERDMQLQREALEGKRAQAASKLTELGLARGAFQDEKTALDWAAAKRKELYAMEMQQVAARSQSEVVRQQGMAAAAQAREQAAQAMAQIYGQREAQGAQVAMQKAQLEQRKQEFAISTAADLQKAQIAASSKAGEVKKLTDGERKQDAVVAGAADAYDRIAKIVNGGGATNAGATAGTLFGGKSYVPDLVTGEDTLQQRADVKNIVRSILRVESGSNVPESEVEGKIEALGLSSGDDAVRARGMQQLLSGFKALDVTGRLQSLGTPSQAAPSGPTRMVNPATGQAYDLTPQQAAAARARGWTDA